jgi:hypothetical protein
MPRKFLVTALALVVAAALAGVAYAANVYNITQGATSPAGKGSKNKPLAKTLKFGYTVKDNAAPRGKPVNKYKIAIEGLSGKYAKFLTKCKYADANGVDHATKCKKATVGSGRVENLTGPGNNPNSNTFCNLKLTVYNLGTGLALRLDADPPAPTEQSGPIGCSIPIHQAINAKFKTVKLDKIETSSLNFDVPLNLRHPGSQFLDNVVANTTATIKGKTTKVKIHGKKRKVGIYSALGCHGKNRTVSVSFSDESGKTTPIKVHTKKC